MVDDMRNSAEASMRIPMQLQAILDRIEASGGDLSMNLKGLDEPIARVTKAANRLVLAILAAAFIIGPAMLVTRLNEIFPEFQTGAVILIAGGMLTSLLITIVLVLSILRSER
jgi:ubiquinone biosynthesis protein